MKWNIYPSRNSPEDRKRYLVTIRKTNPYITDLSFATKYVDVKLFENGKFQKINPLLEDVVAWMELPEIYKEEGE